MFDKTKH